MIHWILTRFQGHSNEEIRIPSTNGAGPTGFHIKNTKFGLPPYYIYKINSKTIQLLQENRKCYNLGFGNPNTMYQRKIT